jgi:hypothetical protein
VSRRNSPQAKAARRAERARAERARVRAGLEAALADPCACEGCDRTGEVEVTRRSDGLSAWLCAPDAAEQMIHLRHMGELESVSVIGRGPEPPELPAAVAALVSRVGITRETSVGGTDPAGYTLLTVTVEP